MSKRARDHGDKRDWQKKWADNACPINWQDLGNGRPSETFHQRKAERIAQRTQQQPQPR